jgi:hypothetical protein
MIYNNLKKDIEFININIEKYYNKKYQQGSNLKREKKVYLL